MMARLTILAFALTSILLAGADLAPSAAELRPARVFSDGMVVQRGVPVPVWGWAAANARVTASLGGQTRTATADATGAWRVAFPAMKAGVRYAVSMDDEAPQMVNITADSSNAGWDRSVADNIRILATKHRVDRPGDHVLRFWLVDPGVVLQKLVIDAGGERPSYLGPPESYRR